MQLVHVLKERKLLVEFVTLVALQVGFAVVEVVKLKIFVLYH